MPTNPTTNLPSAPLDFLAKRALKSSRLLWLIMLASLIFFTTTFYVLIKHKQLIHIQQQALEKHATTLTLISWTVFILFFATAHTVRMQTYKKSWVQHKISPDGYFKGMALFLGILYFATFIHFFIILILPFQFSNTIPFTLDILLFCLNYPHGKPLQQND